MKWYKTRVGLYVIHGALNVIAWYILGFEMAMLIALGQIHGELLYKKEIKL